MLGVRFMTEANIGPVEVIRQHPTVSFFVFAFLISWTGWLIAPTLIPLSAPFSSFISQVGSFGPALSAIFVSSIVNPAPSDASVNKRRIVFAIIFGVTIGCQLLATYAVGGQLTFQTFVFFALNSIIAAYVVSSVYHPKIGVDRLMEGLKRVSGSEVWIWAALLLPFLWQFLGAFVDLGLGGREWFSLTPATLLSLAAYYPFILFFGGGLNEEPGWRGFAVPRVQLRFSPLVAGLIIGVIWSVWHFPLHVVSSFGGGLAGFPFRFVYNVPLGVLFSWLYNRSGGNVFACVLLHASYNSASNLFGDNSALISMVLMIAFTVTVAVYDRMYRKATNCMNQRVNHQGTLPTAYAIRLPFDIAPRQRSLL